jgi:hypothetical protein
MVFPSFAFHANNLLVPSPFSACCGRCGLMVCVFSGWVLRSHQITCEKYGVFIVMAKIKVGEKSSRNDLFTIYDDQDGPT